MFCSFYNSPANSPDAAIGPRSPSPAGRDAKRRRVDAWFPEHSNHLNNEHNAADVVHDHGPFRPSHSAPHLPLVLDLRRQFEPQPRTFLNEDREFMSHIISTRGVMGRTTDIKRTFDRLPSLRRILEHLPVISADKLYFIGWREKTDTWPTDKVSHVQRSFTFPN
jgi:hypothetical protein